MDGAGENRFKAAFGPVTESQGEVMASRDVPGD